MAVLAATVTGLTATSAYAMGSAAVPTAAAVKVIPAAVTLGGVGPGGGVVFYDAGAEQDWGRYLEAAPVGWSKSRRFTATWCIDAVDVATGAEIGDGADNTDAIMDTCDRSGITAAEVASRYRGGRKRDWYLPSRAELDALVSSGLVKIQGLYWTATGTFTERGMRELQGVWPTRAF